MYALVCIAPSNKITLHFLQFTLTVFFFLLNIPANALCVFTSANRNVYLKAVLLIAFRSTYKLT